MTSKTQWVNEIYEKMEQKLYAECARMGEKIPYWTVGGVYEKIMPKKTSTGGPTASGAVSSGSFIMPQKMNFIWKQPEKMKIYWIRPFTASSAFTTIPVSCGSTALSLITASQVPKKPKSAASMQPLFWPEDTIQTENLSGHGILNV